MSNIAIDKSQRTTNNEMKTDVSLKIALMMVDRGLVDESKLRDIKDIIVTVLYDYSIFKIEHTELAKTDEEEFRQLCEFYTTKKYIAGIQKESIRQVLSEVVKFHNFIKKRIPEITTEDIDFYLANRSINSNLKRSTLHGCRLYLSSFFALLYKNKRIVDNPMDGVDSIKLEVTYEVPLSKTEITKLEECCETYREKAMITLLLETGVRVAEFCNLNIEDLDFQKMELFVRQGKGSKDRVVPFGEKSTHIVKQYLLNERPDIDIANGIFPIESPLFTQVKSSVGKRLTTGGVQDILKKIGIKAGITRVHPHLLRKTYATTLYKQGVAINIIARLLGHANLDSISRYVVINNNDIKNVLNNTGII